MAAYTTIDDPSAFFKVHLYAGTGSSNAQTFADTDTDMQPDMVWIKNRDATDNHVLTDAVRGATETLFPNDSGATATVAEGLKSFDSDGYTVGTDVRWNTSTEDYASWNWKMGTTSGLSGGSLTPDGYSFSATAGQGIYEYTGGGSVVTITHGLGSIPKFMLGKRSENDAQEWRVYHEANGPTKFMVLDQNDAVGTNSANWNDTAPTSTLFTIGTSLAESGKVMMNYVFADVQGYSRFGKYYGNANADGPYVYTGFRPAWILLKRTGSADSWQLFDSKRLGYNAANDKLTPNSTTAEGSSTFIDIFSNGFKLTTTNTAVNNSGELNLYAAFAQAPFVNSSGVPVNAR